MVRVDVVAQQSAAYAVTVDADDGDVQRVVLVQAQAADQLVGEGRLASAAGAGVMPSTGFFAGGWSVQGLTMVFVGFRSPAR
jgi:hypothetical protein